MKKTTQEDIKRAMPIALRAWVSAGPSAAEFIGHIVRVLERDGFTVDYGDVFRAVMSEEERH